MALDNGITEAAFWDMTPGEFERAVESKRRVDILEQQKKASFDYILAELIGRSIARIYSSSAKYPAISEVYPTLFDNEDIQQKKQEQKVELSALRFKQFAKSYNEKFKGVQSGLNE